MSGDVVLATRFGPESIPPARVAADLAARFGGRVTVLYVAAELDALAAAGGEAGVDAGLERERVMERVHDELRDFVASAFGDTPVNTRVVSGSVPDQVAAVAEELDAAFIVVGMHARSTLARLILGDTTQSILERANRPAVVVPLDPH